MRGLGDGHRRYLNSYQCGWWVLASRHSIGPRFYLVNFSYLLGLGFPLTKGLFDINL